VLWGRAGSDRLYGGRHGDLLYGGPGDDLLWGGRASDLLVGMGDGRERRVPRRPGSDELDEMGAGRDRAYLGPGNDIATVEADGVRDVIDCGPGRHDEVFFGEADPLDEFIDCETVQPF
jgi:Ca2+-binding RTX toxin-like protein